MARAKTSEKEILEKIGASEIKQTIKEERETLWSWQSDEEAHGQVPRRRLKDGMLTKQEWEAIHA